MVVGVELCFDLFCWLFVGVVVGFDGVVYLFFCFGVLGGGVCLWYVG